MAYAMTVTLQVKPGSVGRVLELLKESAATSRAEDDCLAFEVYRAPDDDYRLWLYEVYTTKEYHDGVHAGLPAIQRSLEAIPPLLATPPVIATGTSVVGH